MTRQRAIIYQRQRPLPGIGAAQAPRRSAPAGSAGPASSRDFLKRATSERVLPAAETDFQNQFQEVIRA
ncbi:hypothetical protein [Glutamicibacter sp.]|uniref:hypothetical protein n=1 Tax=Glutamicibacter sp. TaxID=1931995 RepID=UPI003D6A34F3